MTTDDTDALKDRIRRARSLPAEWARRRDGETTMEQTERWQKRQDEQTAALVAEEVRKAKAEALRETADWWAANPDDDVFETDGDTRNWLRDVATEYETGDSDEHR